MSVFRRILAVLLCSLCALPFSALAAGNQGSSNYLYSPHEELLPVPPAYTLSRSVTARDLPGVDSLQNLTDAFVTPQLVYVLTQTQLIVMTHDFSVVRVATSYTDETGAEVKFAGLSGIFVTEAGDYYLTQPDKAQILHFNADGTLRRVLSRPVIVGFENVNYRPTKLTVDSASRIYVVAKGMYEGIVELNPDGSFSRFYGVNSVIFDVGDLIWRMLATEEQRARQALWLPTDFTNVELDKDGFIFATIQGTQDFPIKRLNSKGENILRVDDDAEYPAGDLWHNQTGHGIPVGPSQFIACDTNDFGMYIALDTVRYRVFAYNEDSKLLFVLGGPGDREGYFRNPIDVDFVNDRIMVLDQLAQSLEIFAPTDYGKALRNAVYYQYNYDYENAVGYWREALSYNHNFSLAYSGIGRALLREEKYDEALNYLEQGDDRKYYTKAFEKVRNQTLRVWFVPGVCGIFGLCALSVCVSVVRKRKKRPGKEASV